MPQPGSKSASSFLIILAFAIVYIVWGSTYYYIQQALKGFPPLLLGALRYFGASILLMAWCIIKGSKLFILKDMKHAAVVGVLLLFIGNGGVIWAEQTIPSAMAAIMVSSAPLWFVILDKNKWVDNFRNRATIIGLIIGFIGVILLFSEPLRHAFRSVGGSNEITGLIILTIAVIAWSGGSLYSKHHPPSVPGKHYVANVFRCRCIFARDVCKERIEYGKMECCSGRSMVRIGLFDYNGIYSSI
jgi:drug/metabolite transporter (DMT)-like permease